METCFLLSVVVDVVSELAGERVLVLFCLVSCCMLMT